MNTDEKTTWRRILTTRVMCTDPRNAFLCGGILGAIAGTCLGIALDETSIREIIALTACGSLGGGAIGSTIAFVNSYPSQARAFVKWTAIVFWIVFLAGLPSGVWQTVRIRHGFPSVIFLAGMLYASIHFGIGTVWGLIAAAYDRHTNAKIGTKHKPDSDTGANTAPKDEHDAN